MAPEGIKQKLTAILSADVKDYSRLLPEFCTGTVLKSHPDRKFLNPGINH